VIRKPGESPPADTRTMHPAQNQPQTWETENRNRYAVVDKYQADVPEFQKKAPMRKKAIDAPYERGHRE